MNFTEFRFDKTKNNNQTRDTGRVESKHHCSSFFPNKDEIRSNIVMKFHDKQEQRVLVE